MEEKLELCNKTPTLIALTAKEWCEPCKNLEPHLIELKKTDRINYHIEQCDQGDEKRKKYIDLFKVQGFPTVFIYHPKLNKFIVCNSRTDIEIKKFISKVHSYISIVELENAKLQIWTTIPTENISFGKNHGESCSSL